MPGFILSEIKRNSRAVSGSTKGPIHGDIDAMMRAQHFPGLSATKAIILASGDCDAIVRAVCGIIERPDLPVKHFLDAARVVVGMDILNVMAAEWDPEVIRAREADICLRSYRLMLATP